MQQETAELGFPRARGYTSTAVRRLLQCLLVLGVCLPAGASAQHDDDDGLYGRFDGELALSVGVGGGLTEVEARGRGASVVGEVRLRYLDAAGVFLAGRWGPGVSEHLALGVELRPLFPALFFEDLWTGHEFWDLLIQSVGVELGVATLPLNEAWGYGLAAGGGLEIPVVLPSQWADGVWLRLGGRYVRGSTGDQGGPDTPHDEWTLYATLAIKTIFGHLFTK